MRQRPSQESSLPDPMLSLSYNSSGDPLPGSGIGREPQPRMPDSWCPRNFPFPASANCGADMASREADAEFQQYLMTRLSVVSRLKQAYHRLHHAYEMIGIMERDRDLLRQILRISEARYSVGKAAQQDIFRAQRSSPDGDETAQEQDKSCNREKPKSTPLNRRPNALGGPSPWSRAELSVTLDELWSRLGRRPGHPPRTEDGGAHPTRAQLARKEYYPDYTVSGGYYYMGSMPAMYMARVDFKLPAYFWRKQRAGRGGAGGRRRFREARI